MTNTQIEVITSVQRRRRWTAAEKEQLVAASLEPGAAVSAIAREAGIHPSQLYGWRRQLCSARATPSFAEVRIAAERTPSPGMSMTPGAIDIEFASGMAGERPHQHAQLCGAHDYAESAAVGGISPLFGSRLV
jgi:transposase